MAEDDPVNSRIIQKRLEKSGHEMHHTVNGEDCASSYGEKSAFDDVVLMDMQVVKDFRVLEVDTDLDLPDIYGYIVFPS